MSSGREIRHLALREFHEATGARFAVAGDWSLPHDYGDPLAEHAALRSAAVAFDASAASRFIVSGTDAAEVLAHAFSGRIDELEEGRATRALSTAADGTIADLVLIARTGAIAYTVSGEPARRSATLARIEAAIERDFDARVEDRTDSTCLIGIAGPAAADVIGAHVTPSLPPRLPALHAVAFEFHGFRALAIRTSETGEDGFALVLAPAVALHLLETLRAGNVALAGTDALEIARVEASIPCVVADLTGLTTAESGLEMLASPTSGGEAERVLAAVLIDGQTPPPPGTPVLAGDRLAGATRSAVRSPALDAIAAFAVLDREHATPGTALVIGGAAATAVQKPLYRRRST